MADERQVRQILDRNRAAMRRQESGAAHRGEINLEQQMLAEARPPALAAADRDIDLVAREVDERVGRQEAHTHRLVGELEAAEAAEQEQKEKESKKKGKEKDGLSDYLKDLKKQGGAHELFNVNFLPTQKEIEAWLVERKKRELAERLGVSV